MKSGSTCRGFALLTVMLCLSVLAVLIGTSFRTVSTHVHLVSQESRQAREAALFRAGLEHGASMALASLAEGAPPLGHAPVVFPIGPDNITVTVQDVGGLIDLNSGQIDLIARFFAAREISSDVATRLADARRTGYRLQSAAELASWMAPESFAAIEPFVTTHSGRPGFDPGAAPLALLEDLTGRSGTRTMLEEFVPVAWRAPQTRRVFNVAVGFAAPDNPTHLGVISVRGGVEPAFLLLALR